MEATEIQANLGQIKKDLQAGLINAENSTENQSGSSAPVIAVKPVLDLKHHLVKSIYKVKKRLQLASISKDVPADIKPKLRPLAEVKDDEAAIVKAVLDHYGSQHLTPEMIDAVNKYLNTPLWPLIEMEFELHEKMKAEVHMIVQQHKKEGDK